MVNANERKQGKASSVRRLLVALALAASAVALTGCLYPKEQLRQNAVPPRDAVRNVQLAIEDYQKELGLLPIKNSTVDTPRYEKFVVDFTKLLSGGYISEVPGAAFEEGGHYYFIVIDEETSPRVKLMDLLTVQYINDLKAQVRDYARAHNGALPQGDEVAPGFYRIDYGLLNKKEKPLRSVYSGQTIPVLLDREGNVYADYAIDIMQAIQKSGRTDFDPSLDLRTLLVDNSVFAPAKSTAYRYVDGEPMPVPE